MNIAVLNRLGLAELDLNYVLCESCKGGAVTLKDARHIRNNSVSLLRICSLFHICCLQVSAFMYLLVLRVLMMVSH